MNKENLLAIRGLFLFTETGNIAYSQRFPTVEMQFSKKYPKLPDNEKLILFYQEQIKNIIKSDSPNVFKFDTDIYLSILPTKSFSICVIPLIHHETKEINIDIDASFHLLSFMESVLRSNLRTLMPDSSLIDFAPIKQIINSILPFGSPVVYDQYFISQLTAKTEISRFTAGYKNLENSFIPSWKTSLVFPCQQLELQIRECIIGAILETRKFYKIFGELVITASLSYLPEVTIPFTLPQTMTNIQSHFSVKEFKNGQLKLTPPTGVSQILTWEVPVSNESMPIDGIYQLSFPNDKTVQYSIKVKFNKNLMQATLHLPFINCGSLKEHKFNTLIGQVKQSRTEVNISWDLPSNEGNECEISGLLEFDENIPKEQEFRALISFKGHNKTFTGNTVIKENVQIDSQTKTGVTVSQSYSTDGKKYIIFGKILKI